MRHKRRIKSLDLETARLTADPYTGRIAGYASIFGNVDSMNEIVDRGAFSEWLDANPDQKVPILWNHERFRLPIGITEQLREDDRGLFYQGYVLETNFGKDIYKAIKGGAVAQSSFAYRILDEYKENGIIHLSKLELIEVSPVTWGANQKTSVHTIGEQQSESGPALAETFAAELRRFIGSIQQGG